MLATALLALLLPLASSDDALFLVEEFERYFPEQEQPAQRREAVLTLSGADSLRATRALLAALQDEDYLVRRAAVDVLAAYRDPEAARFLLEEVLEDRKLSRDEVLVAGVAEVLGGMRAEGAFGPLAALLESRELGVRLGAVAGLGRLGDTRAVLPLSLLAAPDGGAEEAVAVAAVQALERIGDAEAAREPVIAALTHPSKAVRLAAVSAAHGLRHKAFVGPLIARLDPEEDARVAEDAHDALTDLTLRSFTDDQATWATWWERARDRWELPDAELVKAARERVEREGSKYTTGKSFQGIETRSDNILFVIDVSESMDQPFGDPERLERSGRTYSSNRRLDIVKEELSATIEALSEDTAFNIVSFATDVEVWKRRPVKANVLNKSNALSWVAELSPKGGAGNTFRARAGLAAGGDAEGQTNTHLALMTAFGEEVEEDARRRKPRELVTDLEDPVDTIFFLTDGEPTTGITTDMNAIREEVRRVNRFRGVQLHVIYVGTHGGNQFELLAEENDGVFVNVGS